MENRVQQPYGRYAGLCGRMGLVFMIKVGYGRTARGSIAPVRKLHHTTCCAFYILSYPSAIRVIHYASRSNSFSTGFICDHDCPQAIYSSFH